MTAGSTLGAVAGGVGIVAFPHHDGPGVHAAGLAVMHRHRLGADRGAMQAAHLLLPASTQLDRNTTSKLPAAAASDHGQVIRTAALAAAARGLAAHIHELTLPGTTSLGIG